MEVEKEFITTYVIERVAKDKNDRDLSTIKAVTQDVDDIKKYVLMFANEALQTKEKYESINTSIYVTIFNKPGVSYFKLLVADFDAYNRWYNCAPIYGSYALNDKEREEFRKRFYFELRLSGEYEKYVGKDRKGH